MILFGSAAEPIGLLNCLDEMLHSLHAYNDEL